MRSVHRHQACRAPARRRHPWRTRRVEPQRQVPDKKGEITAFVPLLTPLDSAVCTVTFDALHIQNAHARFLVEAKNAHCIAIVKDNHPKLHAFLKHLPYADLLTRLDDAALIVSVTEQSLMTAARAVISASFAATRTAPTRRSSSETHRPGARRTIVSPSAACPLPRRSSRRRSRRATGSLGRRGRGSGHRDGRAKTPPLMPTSNVNSGRDRPSAHWAGRHGPVSRLRP